MNDTKMFTVIPKNAFQDKEVQVLEAIINRPEFTNKVMAAVEQYVNKFLMPKILYGTVIDPKEVEDFITRVVEESAGKPGKGE